MYTIKLYNSLVIKRNKDISWRGVLLIPIICIEYYMADVCKKYGYFNKEQLNRLVCKYLVGCFEWSKIPLDFKGVSLEKMYKRLFLDKSFNKDCLKNTNKYGKFFINDCDCKDCLFKGLSINKKAEQLYTNLPVFDVINEEHKNIIESFCLEVEEASLDKIQENIQGFYDEICEKMGKVTIVVSVYKYNNLV